MSADLWGMVNAIVIPNGNNYNADIGDVITNEFIGEGFYLSQHSMDGYEAIGFDVTQATQDVEQILVTIHSLRVGWRNLFSSCAVVLC